MNVSRLSKSATLISNLRFILDNNDEFWTKMNLLKVFALLFQLQATGNSLRVVFWCINKFHAHIYLFMLPLGNKILLQIFICTNLYKFCGFVPLNQWFFGCLKSFMCLSAKSYYNLGQAPQFQKDFFFTILS